MSVNKSHPRCHSLLITAQKPTTSNVLFALGLAPCCYRYMDHIHRLYLYWCTILYSNNNNRNRMALNTCWLRLCISHLRLLRVRRKPSKQRGVCVDAIGQAMRTVELYTKYVFMTEIWHIYKYIYTKQMHPARMAIHQNETILNAVRSIECVLREKAISHLLHWN